MDTFEFIVSLVHILAWPVVVFTVVLILRRQLFILLDYISGSLTNFPHIRSVKGFGLEFDFSDQLEKTDENISLIPHIDTNIDPSQVALSSNTSKSSATEIVLAAWLMLKEVPLTVAESLGMEGDTTNLYAALKYLVEKGIIIESVVEVIHKFENMKNKTISTRGSKVSKKEARKYAEQTQVVTHYFYDSLQRLSDTNPELYDQIANDTDLENFFKYFVPSDKEE